MVMPRRKRGAPRKAAVTPIEGVSDVEVALGGSFNILGHDQDVALGQ